MIITSPFAIDALEKIAGRRIHSSPAASFIHRSKNEKPRESLAACPWFDVVLSVKLLLPANLNPGQAAQNNTRAKSRKS
jgi:hypothetical protein